MKVNMDFNSRPRIPYGDPSWTLKEIKLGQMKKMPPDTVVTNLHIIMSRTERKYRFLKKFDERFAMRSQNVWGMGRCGKWHPELRTVKS